MKTKVILASLFLSLVFVSCKEGDKKEGAEDVSKVQVVEKAVQDSLSVENLEGKVVMAENGDWFVIKDGLRWKAMSEAATTDYLNSIANGQNNVVKNVPLRILESFPIAGEIFPKVEFKKEEAKK